MQAERSPFDVAWAAGLFEGEGCWTTFNGGKTIRAALGMTDRDVVERFAQIIGFGRIHVQDLPNRVAKGWKPCHYWVISDAVQVCEVIHLFMPYMGDRRRAKAQELLRIAEGIRVPHGRETHCPHGHPYAGENLIVNKRGHRSCRTCYCAYQRVASRQRRARERAS